MNPESSDSDVSVGGGDEYRFASPLTAPIPLPPPPSKHALESSDAVQARLDDLQRIEDHNVKKYDLLRAKRARKDEKIRRNREIQDQKWNLIVEARQRRDSRIAVRRRREDAAFVQFDHDLEEEESVRIKNERHVQSHEANPFQNLRRRLKRLKRGLPLDESPKPGGRSISSSSMSPPGPGLSTLPPPPKRHQVGPPGQPDAINPSQSRPSPQSTLAVPAKSTLPPPAPPSAPPYSFYNHGSSSSYPRPYHHSPYSTTPASASPPAPTNGSSHLPPPAGDRMPYSSIGRPASPLSKPLASAVPSNQSPAASATSSQPRQIYDTRPPPTTSSSGFASINAPPAASGFATINPRTTGTPPASHVPLSRPLNEIDMNRTPSHHMNNGMDSNRFHPYTSAPNSAAATPTASTGSKRTPSTTHPYQMSEAFANRHHHCERVDSLNRGIWTSYGVGGTAETPNGPPVEMYLRCNHDGCSRIDWRTVHGLQCHIVKNHEQPKGTIGSLEKALERYGVPVKEIEDFEREHGKGTAGTMADPKNLKMKLKTKLQDFSRKSTPVSYAVDPDARPAGYKPSPTATDDSPTVSDGIKKSPETSTTNGLYNTAPIDEAGRQSAPQTAPTSPSNAFTSVRRSWMTATPPATRPANGEAEPKSLQGNVGVTSVNNGSAQMSQPGLSNGTSLSTPPSTVKVAPPRSEPTSGFMHIGAPQRIPAAQELPSEARESLPPRAEFNSRTHPVEATTTNNVTNQEPAPATDKANAVPLTAEPQSENGKPDGEQLQEKPIPAQELVEAKAKDEDVEMTGMHESGKDSKEETTKDDETLEKGDSEKPETNTEDRSETIEVDNYGGKETTGPNTRKSNHQSPTITTRSLTATTPGSARRPSRRSSAARKSVDVDGETGKPLTQSEDGDRDEKENKDEKPERIEPRRSLTGRILRRGTRY